MLQSAMCPNQQISIWRKCLDRIISALLPNIWSIYRAKNTKEWHFSSLFPVCQNHFSPILLTEAFQSNFKSTALHLQILFVTKNSRFVSWIWSLIGPPYQNGKVMTFASFQTQFSIKLFTGLRPRKSQSTDITKVIASKS